MNNEEILENLSSKEYNRIIDTLFRLGSEKVRMPSPAVFDKMIELISDSDADIRERAIFAVGLHWHHAGAVPRIIEVLRNAGEDESVLACAAGAIGSIAHDTQAVREVGVRELAKVIANKAIPQEVRDTAYVSILWATHRIPPDEYARRSALPSQGDYDWDWLNSILRGADCASSSGDNHL